MYAFIQKYSFLKKSGAALLWSPVLSWKLKKFQLERDFQLEIKKFPHIVKQGNYHFYNWKSSHKVSMVTILQVSMETILQVSMETLI